MNMKWSMSFLALSGALAYALIFLAQSDGDAVAESERSADLNAPAPVAVAEAIDGSLDDSATADVAELVTVDPTEETSQSNFDDPWKAGVSAFQQGDMTVALAALKASVEERTNSAYRHFLLGLAFRRSGELEAAVTELDRSRTLAPENVKTLVALGRAQLDVGNPEAAREAVDRSLDLDLDNADAWHVLGRIESSSGNVDEAEAAFRGAVTRDADHAWAWNNLGYLYIQQERFDAARDALLHAVQSPNADAVFFNNLGVAYERTEDLSRAALAYAKADLLGSEASTLNHERVAGILDARGESYAGADSIETLSNDELLAALEPDVEDADAAIAQLDPMTDFDDEPAEESKD